MKKTLILLTMTAVMTIGCDWLDRKPVVDGCGKCGKCATGCCLKGVCATEGCDCGCKH